MTGHELRYLEDDDVVLDAIPDDVEATIQVRDRWINSLGAGSAGLEFIVSDVRSWTPGQKIGVAFLGGGDALHRDIAEATKPITDVCNITLDFGFDAQNGKFRAWSEQDSAHAAEIRVSFDQKGFFSLVGIDSIDANVGSPFGPVGGRAHQRSLNLGGFTVRRPANWIGVVRHEFLHALSFQHSHQNMRGACEHDFRWDDDAGYVPTKNANGGFVSDAGGRRPGIYTYLAGYPNFWDRAKVDHNLRTTDDPTSVAGAFDRKSVMLYRFPPLFYKNPNTQCSPEGDGITLSEGDLRGLRLLYPKIAQEAAQVVVRKEAALNRIDSTIEREYEGLETEGPRVSTIAQSVSAILRRNLAARRDDLF